VAKSGKTEVNEMADGYSIAGAWADVHPHTVPKINQLNPLAGPNENAASYASGLLTGLQKAYAWNDVAFGLNTLSAEADADLHLNSPMSLDADAGVYSSSSTFRTNVYLNPAYRALSEDWVTAGRVSSVARDNQVGTIVESSMDADQVGSGSHQWRPSGFLSGNIGSGVESYWYETMGPSVYGVNTGNYVWTLGPVYTGSVLDDAGVTERLTDIHGKSAKSKTSLSKYQTDIAAKNYIGWIVGNDATYHNYWDPAPVPVLFYTKQPGQRSAVGPSLDFAGNYASGRLEATSFTTTNYGWG
jgi:hypothetical protein